MRRDKAQYGHGVVIRSLKESNCQKLTNEQKIEVIERYTAGELARDIAKDYGLHHTNIYLLMRKRGIPRRNRGSWQVTLSHLTEDEKQDLIRLYKTGIPCPVLAESCGVSSTIIQRFLRRHGIKLRGAARLSEQEILNRLGKTHNITATYAHKSWRWKVLERDAHECKTCKGTKNLQAHHIWPRALFCDLTFREDNGITLCRECHRKIRGREIELIDFYLELIGSTLSPSSQKYD